MLYVFIHLVKEMVPPKGQPFLVPLFHQPPVTDLFSLGETTDRSKFAGDYEPLARPANTKT